MALGDDIRSQLEMRAAEPALYFGKRTYSGAEFLNHVRAITLLWADNAPAPGTPIALLARNRPLHIAALVAALDARARTSMVATSQSRARLAEDVRARCPSVVVAAREDWCSELDAAVGDMGALGIEFAGDYAAQRVPPAVGRTTSTIDPDIAFDLLSSGTTGRPKPIPIRWRTIQEAVDDARAVYAAPAGAMTGRPPAVVIQPLANVAGVTFVVPALAHGQPLVLLERFELDSWVAVIERYRPTRTSLPPAALRMILDAGVAPQRLSSLKVIGIGGARLDEALRAEFEARYGTVLVPAYGATEFGGVIASWNLDEYREVGARKRGSVGRARPGVRLRIVNRDTGAPAAIGETGILEAQVDRVGPEWIRTTDLAWLDADEFLFLAGRDDAAINRGGFKIVPEVVTDVLRKHPAVADAAVFGVPDRRLGEVPVAAIELRPGVTEPDARELEALCREHLLAYQVPVRYVVMASLPRTDSLKVELGKLREICGSNVEA
jgi:acyl-CoA synthetase (AMP-forming)/AMP-acid ligase II